MKQCRDRGEAETKARKRCKTKRQGKETRRMGEAEIETRQRCQTKRRAKIEA